ncbi:MAG TPA: hypothetical protein VMZ05_11885 [Spirochaetota bacterium]|nr:hypothetical protein [Spirochaetota bacterium]
MTEQQFVTDSYDYPVSLEIVTLKEECKNGSKSCGKRDVKVSPLYCCDFIASIYAVDEDQGDEVLDRHIVVSENNIPVSPEELRILIFTPLKGMYYVHNCSNITTGAQDAILSLERI